jgi:hypothetical protein
VSGRYADSVYDHNAPGAQSAGEAYVSYTSNEERLVSEALAAQLMRTPDEIRAIRPTTAATPLFPSRRGEKIEPGIADVVMVDRRYPDSSAAFSGRSGSYSGTSTPSLGWW